LAGLWGGAGALTAARAWESGDGDRQMRAMKSSAQVLQMELMDARQQAERSAENEGRARAQLQRVLSENDAALVMLGQVFAQRFAACCPLLLCACFLTIVCSEKRSSRYYGLSLRMLRWHFESSCGRSCRQQLTTAARRNKQLPVSCQITIICET
jgi:hypothetical protein